MASPAPGAGYSFGQSPAPPLAKVKPPYWFVSGIVGTVHMPRDVQV